MGHCAGVYAGTATSAIVIGACAGMCFSPGINQHGSGYGNIFVGEYAGKCVTTGIVNVLIGKCAGCCLHGSHTTIAIGANAGAKTCAANDNVFIGTSAGECNTTGSTNVMIGNKVGRVTTCGNNNIFLGQFAGCHNVGGSSNVYVGNCSGYKTQGHKNVMIGLSAGHNRCGNKFNHNTLIGRSAGTSCGTLAIGNFDVFIGYTAGKCYTGSCSIGIGHSVRMPITDGQNQLAIGQDTCHWITGTCDYNVGIGITTPTSKLHVGGDAVVVGVVTATDFDATSDIRLKTNIKPIDDPIAKVIQIEGVSFNWKKDNQPALGVIADQVEKILPELVHGDDPKTVNYNGLIGLLIEVVKDQQKQINTLSERISKLE